MNAIGKSCKTAQAKLFILTHLTMQLRYLLSVRLTTATLIKNVLMIKIEIRRYKVKGV